MKDPCEIKIETYWNVNNKGLVFYLLVFPH